MESSCKKTLLLVNYFFISFWEIKPVLPPHCKSVYIEYHIENIATGETSQAITPYHFFNYINSLAFITR